jgi:hypothetical protein
MDLDKYKIQVNSCLDGQEITTVTQHKDPLPLYENLLLHIFFSPFSPTLILSLM